jgi:hypothetical protein
MKSLHQPLGERVEKSGVALELVNGNDARLAAEGARDRAVHRQSRRVVADVVVPIVAAIGYGKCG